MIETGQIGIIKVAQEITEKDMKDTKTTKAFTLIELLVVIAIIGILSSVVLAAISSARESARDTRRLQDMRQIQTALEMFYNDNGHYPNNTRASGNSGYEDSSLNNGQFIDPLVNQGYLPNYVVDPVNQSPLNYEYYNFNSGYGSCPDSGYMLGIREFESSDGTHSSSPEFDCDGGATQFADDTSWVTGSYE